MSIGAKLARQQSTFFKINYAPDYKTFIPNFIIADRLHPLNESQRRLQNARKREGLWWHVTTGVDLSKSSCVRSWARRRLRTAFVEELKARGYNENGISNSPGTPSTRPSCTDPPIPGTPTDLTGSLRLHVQAPLIPAKFVEIKAAVAGVIDAIVEGKNHKITPSNHMKRPLKQPRKVVPVGSGSHAPATKFHRLKPS